MHKFKISWDFPSEHTGIYIGSSPESLHLKKKLGYGVTLWLGVERGKREKEKRQGKEVLPESSLEKLYKYINQECALS